MLKFSLVNQLVQLSTIPTFLILKQRNYHSRSDDIHS
uniref:Bm13314 n=1 Tax=Brugia malayi TaxID=6279 RepID=A0A0J9Y2V6_BRUMA|nr:Bm13314 [Brugia malayi]